MTVDLLVDTTVAGMVVTMVVWMVEERVGSMGMKLVELTAAGKVARSA